MKVVTVVGARPHFIKASVVSRALRARPEVLEVIVHTGQHYDADMSEVFFEELNIPKPNYHLGIGSGTHGAQTGRMIEAVEEVLLRERPDWTVVFGDTNSTLAGALASVKQHIPVAHVEAGLRSFNRRMPEEINRVLTDHASNLLFAPTETAVRNLEREGIDARKVRLVGDVMYDAALFFGRLADEHSRVLDRLSLKPKDYILCTIHRAENTDDPSRLRAIVEGIGRVAATHRVVWPLHPRTRRALEQHGLANKVPARLSLEDAVGYLDMVQLERHASLIATDSGGVQKEAFFHRVPCVTLRDETEWVELVDLGWNRLVPPEDAARVHQGILSGLDSTGVDSEQYGRGDSAQRVVEWLATERAA